MWTVIYTVLNAGIFFNSSVFGQGIGPIFEAYINCDGSETSVPIFLTVTLAVHTVMMLVFDVNQVHVYIHTCVRAHTCTIYLQVYMYTVHVSIFILYMYNVHVYTCTCTCTCAFIYMYMSKLVYTYTMYKCGTETHF